MLFLSCKQETDVTNNQILRIEGKQINISDKLSSNDTIDNYIKPYRDHIDEDLKAPLAYNPFELDKSDGELNTAIGNLMADVVMQKSSDIFKRRTGKDVDGVLLNFGGIRAPIPSGHVTARTGYEIMPFENSVVVQELTAAKMKEMVAYLAKNKTAHPISGFKIKLDKRGAVKEFLVGGKPLDPNRSYYIATSDYLMNGGDNMNFFLDALSSTPLDYHIRNAMIDYFAETDTIRTQRDNRYTRE
ncbi:5'-nucleotidase C-terminal domain-containing protein [Sinomicrobium sp.]